MKTEKEILADSGEILIFNLHMELFFDFGQFLINQKHQNFVAS